SVGRFFYCPGHKIRYISEGLDFTSGEIQRKAKHSLNPMSDAIYRRLPPEFMQLEGRHDLEILIAFFSA
ncbi:MAG: hypothetical protein ACREXM_20140, partial [Gammaproteobacteria bacterium]